MVEVGEVFDKYKCSRCKTVFSTGRGDNGFCPHCDKNKAFKARYMPEYDL